LDQKLNEMIIATKTSKIENDSLKEKRKVQRMEEKENRAIIEITESSKEVSLIRSLGLSINKYIPSDPEAEYYDAEEYYYCSNDKWDVTVRNLLYDADLDTILQVLDLTDKNTGEKIDFYCDLWCGNTPNSRLEQLKYLLNHSEKEFIDNEYGKYYSIPKMLRKKGYEIEEKDYTFNFEGCKGYLLIKNSVITNKRCELSIDHHMGETVYLKSEICEYRPYDSDRIIYPVDYKGEQNIGELIIQIDSILKHIDGQIGFKENNTYYSNDDLERFFDDFEIEQASIVDITDAYDSEYFYNEHPSEEDVKEFERMEKIAAINKYTGSEIYKKYEITLFHDTYHYGGIDNVYEIEFTYNMSLDPKYCLLKIACTKNEYFGRNNLIEKDCPQDENVKSSVINIYKTKGKFSEIFNIVEEFLNGLKHISGE
jgi:hypothetical protein